MVLCEQFRQFLDWTANNILKPMLDGSARAGSILLGFLFTDRNANRLSKELFCELKNKQEYARGGNQEKQQRRSIVQETI